jgi:hypothetical protein
MSPQPNRHHFDQLVGRNRFIAPLVGFMVSSWRWHGNQPAPVVQGSTVRAPACLFR